MRFLMIFIFWLTGCASIEEQAITCRSEGMRPVLVEYQQPIFTCECDHKSTFVPCRQGSTIITPGKACGLQTYRKLECYPIAPAAVAAKETEKCDLYGLLNEICS